MHANELVTPPADSGARVQATVALVTPDAQLRERVTTLLALAAIVVVANLESTDDVCLATDGAVDIVILAPGLDEPIRLDAVRRVRESLGDVPVIVLAPPGPRRIVGSALRARVDGFVFLTQLEVALGPTVMAVLGRQVVVPREERAVLAPAMSHRERQVLALVVLGHSNAQVADRLFLSESTVKSHLTSSFGKLGVSSRSEASTLILDPEDPIGRAVMDSLRAEVDAFAGGPRWP